MYRIKNWVIQWKWNVLSAGLFLLLWEILSFMLGNDYLFPSVRTVLSYMLDLAQTSDFYRHLFITLFRAAECLMLSFILALPVSYLLCKSRVAEKLLAPFLYFMKTTPVIAFLLLALIWLSSEQVPLFIAFVGMLPILVINITSGFRSIEKGHMEMASVYKLSVFRKFIYMEYPVLKTFLIAGISGALGLGWRAIIIGEALASVPYGLGAAMKQAQNYVDVPWLFAITLVSLLASYALEMLVKSLLHVKLHRLFPVKRRSVFKRSKSVQSNNKVLSVQELSFRRKQNRIFEGFNMHISKGEIVLLTGVSGVGKSTLIDIIAGIEKDFGGTVTCGDISVLFQQSRLCPWLTIREHIDLYLPVEVSEDQVRELSKVMQIDHLTDKYSPELSGGEIQRINLMLTLLYPADLYMLDEPLTGIGEEHKIYLLEWIRNYMKQNGATVLWISHDPEHKRISDRIVELEDI
ncbi:MAG: ATP-binding cassette domain-containing protein [Bacteroidales bacterium]